MPGIKKKFTAVFFYMCLTCVVQAQSFGDYFSLFDAMGGLCGGTTNYYIMGRKYTNYNPSDPLDTLIDSHTSMVMPSIGITWHFPVATFNDDNASFGIHTGGYLSIGQAAMLHFPLLVQLKTGPDATISSKSHVGFAIGGGYTALGLTGDAGRGWFFKPTVQPEVSFLTRNDNLMKVRVIASFGRQFSRIKSENETHDTYFNSPFIGVYYGYCWNY